jgi:cutinase
MNSIGVPPIVIGSLYMPKTAEFCALADPVCSDGGNWSAHNAYTSDGMVDQAAFFAARHLSSTDRWQSAADHQEPHA